MKKFGSALDWAAKSPHAPLAEQIVHADAVHAEGQPAREPLHVGRHKVSNLQAGAVHRRSHEVQGGMVSLRQLPSLSWGRSPSRQNGSAGPDTDEGELKSTSPVFTPRSGSRASYAVAGDQGAGPQVLRDPRPSAQRQKRTTAECDVLVEVHPGTRRQECLISVEHSVHPSDGHTPLR